MNKQLVMLMFIVFTTISVHAQYFEGKVTYSNTYETNMPTMPSEKWKAMMGDKQEYYIKDGSYKSVFNGQLMQWMIYLNAENKLCNKLSNSEAVSWYYGTERVDSIVSVQVNKNVTKILGYACDELIITKDTGVDKYYFAADLKINAALFEKHKSGNWHNYLKHAGAVPLKMETSSQYFVMKSVATNVKAMPLESSLFELPQGVELVRQQVE